jgi:O-antigen ligase
LDGPTIGQGSFIGSPPRLAAALVGFLLLLGGGLSAVYGVPLARSLALLVLLLLLLLRFRAGGGIRELPAAIRAYLLLLLVLLVGLFYTRDPETGALRLLISAAFWGAFAFAFYQVFGDARSISYVLAGALAGGVAHAGLLMASIGDPFTAALDVSRFYRLALNGENPIHIARAMSVAMLIGTWWLLRSERVLARLAVAALVALMGGYLVLTGSKGPMLGFAIGLVVILGALPKRALVRGVATAAAYGAGVLLLVRAAPAAFLEERFLQGGTDSLAARLETWTITAHAYASSRLLPMVFGHGTGDSAYLLLGRSAQAYPHNIYLELLYENGAVGLMVLTAATLVPLMMLARASLSGRLARDEHVAALVPILVGLYLFALVSAQFSGDLSANQWIPIAGTMLVTALSLV